MQDLNIENKVAPRDNRLAHERARDNKAQSPYQVVDPASVRDPYKNSDITLYEKHSDYLSRQQCWVIIPFAYKNMLYDDDSYADKVYLDMKSKQGNKSTGYARISRESFKDCLAEEVRVKGIKLLKPAIVNDSYLFILVSVPVYYAVQEYIQSIKRGLTKRLKKYTGNKYNKLGANVLTDCIQEPSQELIDKFIASLNQEDAKKKNNDVDL
jgi:hypothetical protein